MYVLCLPFIYFKANTKEKQNTSGLGLSCCSSLLNGKGKARLVSAGHLSLAMGATSSKGDIESNLQDKVRVNECCQAMADCGGEQQAAG